MPPPPKRQSSHLHARVRLSSDDELAAYDDAANAKVLATVRAERAAFQPLILEALNRSLAVDRFAHRI
jgi:hypothetical protein